MVWDREDQGSCRKEKRGDSDDDAGWVTIQDDRGWDVEPAGGTTLEVGKKVDRT